MKAPIIALAVGALILSACGGDSVSPMEVGMAECNTEYVDEDGDPDTDPKDDEGVEPGMISEDVYVEDGTLIVSGAGQQDEDSDSDLPTVDGMLSYMVWACLEDELDLPAFVQERIATTRALDGRQEDEWENDGVSYEASWSYHPNSGLNVVIKEG